MNENKYKYSVPCCFLDFGIIKKANAIFTYHVVNQHCTRDRANSTATLRRVHVVLHNDDTRRDTLHHLIDRLRNLFWKR